MSSSSLLDFSLELDNFQHVSLDSCQIWKILEISPGSQQVHVFLFIIINNNNNFSMALFSLGTKSAYEIGAGVFAEKDFLCAAVSLSEYMCLESVYKYIQRKLFQTMDGSEFHTVYAA